MIRILALALVALAQPTLAQPLFQDVSRALPKHQYTGGWEHFVGGGLSAFDCSGDGRPDMVAAGGSAPLLLLKNVSDRDDIAFEPAKLPTEITHVTGAYPLDIDADGVLDLYVMRVGPDKVLRGGADCSFEDMTQRWGIPQSDQWTTSFTAWWNDDMAFPTMAVGHYVDRADPQGPFGTCDSNTLLIPAADEAPYYTAQVLNPGFCALSMLAAQDARGQLSLRISNDRHYYVSGGSEQLWEIEAKRFLAQEDGWPAVSLWGMGIASRDLTGDQRDEVMLTSMGDQLMQIAQIDGTYKNAPYDIGTYAHSPYLKGDGRPSTGWHAAFADVDNDARADLFIAKGNVDQMPSMAMLDPNNLLIQGADGRFTEAGATAGVADTARSRGAALADFDGDGLVDLAVVNRRADMRLYRNVTSDAGHWVKVQLEGPEKNRFAIGARVIVMTEGIRQSQQITIGGGHAGATLLPLHFGIGAEQQATVQVQWPDGTLGTFVKALADTTIDIRYPH
ncbi:MAG: CRTAC1 family protein [Sulfitobacter sp.]|uniref:CRTAC1 family protein n=1 Tax=Sulfitobacter sp. TaxID=1903071 RepID=UPI0040587A1C